ncbi:HlyD family efflux transporter periplasmic adaptor subunit [Singulisphaera acidiphila]|uniref:Multidrug resistance efflux pump n=1 Tax=Singulisphaera acidiphila (strain ATCC BAA-1392 / DSM 18658 / VKM B-2454 / MOB10) TaxID=886293 RepID=L0DPZ9_SINAD|nr:HlyD family efflux transporter periplasmic adaptor subunit [Singulisphaera acidiphila]AGA30913.1 multidrug resistance efflux pump [Singulisphaera acidiphila DSM 18658]
MSSAPSQVPTAAPMGQAAEHLQVKLRPDLIVQPQFYEGMTHYVIKDPIALKYFRFKIEEYFLLQQFDGKTNLQDVKRAFERKYRPQTISIEDLTRFTAQLHEAGLAQIDSPDQAKVLIRRRRKNQWKKVWQFIANILYIKIPVVDPEKMLTGMYPYFRWLFTPYFITFSVGMMLAALTLVASQWSTFSARLPDFQSFFNWSTIFYFWCSLAIIKIIHEFGHGLTAKHFGGEVHEMGMLFLVLTPALYCDVTDSWLLPSKWKRIWISAAGIYVECFLASLATFVWWNTEQGLLNSLSLATMFICSVNTILFNANPLLRYDGYYVMADWLEIPNLRIKSTQFFTYLFQEKVLGLEVPVQSYMPRSRRSLFVTYAVASYVYRWIVTFSILFFLYKFLQPYKLGSISAIMAVGSLVPLVGMPIYQMFKFVRTPGRMRKVKKARAAGFAVAAIAILAGILLIPTPLRVQGTLVLTAAKPEEVYAEVPGRLVELKVRDSQWVKAGDELAILSNPEKVRERMQLQEQQGVNFVKATWFGRGFDSSSRAQSKQYEQMANDLEPVIGKVVDQLGKLTLVAHRDGQVMGVPHPETVGQWLKPGKPFCEVGDPHQLEAHMILDQGDIDLVKLGRRTWLKIYGDSEITFKSHVGEISKRNSEEISPELSNLAGGEIATKQDPKTNQAKPLTAVYEVIIPLDNANLALQPGLRGFAKIDGGTHTLGWWLWRLITKTFHFTL